MEVTIDLSSVEIHDIEIEPDEQSSSIHFELEGDIQDLTAETIETVAGNNLNPTQLVCEIEDGSNH